MHGVVIFQHQHSNGTLEVGSPNFVSSVDDISLRLGESVNVTLPVSDHRQCGDSGVLR